MIYFVTNEGFLQNIHLYDMILFMTTDISHTPIYHSTFSNFQHIVQTNNYRGIVVDVIQFPSIFKMFSIKCLPSFINLRSGETFGDCKV